MKEYTLFESTEAETFKEAHLLGNGSLGAAVFGGFPHEKILINHDTLWSGQEQLKVHPGTKQNFHKARNLVLEEKLKEANNLINDEMLGYWSECYEPLGYLHLTFGQTYDWRSMKLRKILQKECENYSRRLTLNDALETIEYDVEGVHYKREMFASFPDNVIAIKITAEGGPLSFAMAMDSELRHEERITPDALGVLGRAPDRVEPFDPVSHPELGYKEDKLSDAIRFSACARITETDGEIIEHPMRLYVTDATYAIILLSAGTNYNGYNGVRDKEMEKVFMKCDAIVNKAATKGYDNLKAAHIMDYSELFNRVDVEIGTPLTDMIPTSRRLESIATVLDDPSVSALVLQYVRYLTIASSRPGSQPMNLQGIWNPNIIPSWGSNYTTNINVQMNYWSTEVLGLSECHLPLIEMVKELAHSGEIAARELYGMNGWVTHHNTDLWRMTTIAGEDAAWCWWPFGGVWLCHHLWQHYIFTRDEKYLREIVQPVLKGAAIFLLDFLVEDHDGYLVSPPSTSPENKFFLPGVDLKQELSEFNPKNRFSPNQQQVCAVSKTSAMDMALSQELFDNYLKTLDILGIDDRLSQKIEMAIEKLYPFKIGKHGQLQEWDQDYDECTPGMGHVSHLYTVYPSSLFSETKSPELFEAARKSFLRRRAHNGLTQGWPGSWGLALAARFKDDQLCGTINKSIAQNFSANMLTKEYIQIDSIMGWGAGIAEMLLQSHDGIIDILPSIPPLWVKGYIKGIRARNALILDIYWEEGSLKSLEITAQLTGTYKVRYKDLAVDVVMTEGETIHLTKELVV